jgi:hypothetical protein
MIIKLTDDMSLMSELVVGFRKEWRGHNDQKSYVVYVIVPFGHDIMLSSEFMMAEESDQWIAELTELVNDANK